MCRCAQVRGALQQHPGIPVRGPAAARGAPGSACAGDAAAASPAGSPRDATGAGGVSAVGDTRGHCLSSVAASFWDSEQN